MSFTLNDTILLKICTASFLAFQGQENEREAKTGATETRRQGRCWQSRSQGNGVQRVRSKQSPWKLTGIRQRIGVAAVVCTAGCLSAYLKIHAGHVQHKEIQDIVGVDFLGKLLGHLLGRLGVWHGEHQANAEVVSYHPGQVSTRTRSPHTPLLCWQFPFQLNLQHHRDFLRQPTFIYLGHHPLPLFQLFYLAGDSPGLPISDFFKSSRHF